MNKETTTLIIFTILIIVISVFTYYQMKHLQNYEIIYQKHILKMQQQSP